VKTRSGGFFIALLAGAPFRVHNSPGSRSRKLILIAEILTWYTVTIVGLMLFEIPQ